MSAKARYLFFSWLADAIHAVRYAMVPMLDWAWKRKDEAKMDLDGWRK